MDTINQLEFNQIQMQLASLCKSEHAKKQSLSLHMYEDKDCLQHDLNQLQEAMDIHRFLGVLPLHEMDHISGILKKASIDGTLSIEECNKVKRVLHNIESVKNYFGHYEKPFHYLRDEIEGLVGSKPLLEALEKAITPDNQIDDHASSKLYSIRKQMRQIETNIRSTMESYLVSNKDKLALDNLTTRNNRLVLAVKSIYQSTIKGLIHATSSTGQTMFIEPEKVVLMNNQMNELKVEEAKEIHEILFGFSQTIKRLISLRYDIELLELLDFVFAKAHLSDQYQGEIAHIGGKLQLFDARHPFIDAKKIVSNTIKLDKQMLLITGSNTGGKSVVLKTAGLLSYMALSGLSIPVSKASVPFYSQILVDMGDGQSIEQSLSTYSSHLKNMIYFTQVANDSTLLLIDEIGSGTDPQEGSSIAMALLDYFLDQHAQLLVSTHYGMLKNYGKSREEVVMASVGFDQESFTPTYKLTLDSIGSSYAFEIAQALGLNESLIKKGIKYKEENLLESDRLIEKLTKQNEQLQQEQIKLQALIQENKEKEEKLNHKLKRIEELREKTLKQAKEEANQIIDQTKLETKEILNQIKQEKELKDHHITNANQALDKMKMIEKQEIKQTHQLKVGDQVKVLAMNRQGEIIEIKKNHKIVVSLSGLPLELKDSEVIFIHEKVVKKKVESTRSIKVKKTGHYEVNVIGMRYQEAMDTVDKFLDDALVLGYPSVRIIHGMGTGTLRNGIHKMLEKKKIIKNYRNGGPNEGGLGATLAYFE